MYIYCKYMTDIIPLAVLTEQLSNWKYPEDISCSRASLRSLGCHDLSQGGKEPNVVSLMTNESASYHQRNIAHFAKLLFEEIAEGENIQFERVMRFVLQQFRRFRITVVPTCHLKRQILCESDALRGRKIDEVVSDRLRHSRSCKSFCLGLRVGSKGR
jgi:hypothetical protein